MKIPTNLLEILRLFALKKKSATVSFNLFYDYLQQYVRHYLEKEQSLSVYLEISKDKLLNELKDIQRKKDIEVVSDMTNETAIFVPYFFIDNIAKRFAGISEKPDIPFPLLSELPPNFPPNLIRKVDLSDDFARLQRDENGKNFLYELSYNDSTPSLVFPGFYNADKLLNVSLLKIKLFLAKDEVRDYMRKRLMLANPGKDFTIRKFVTLLASYTSESFNNIKDAGESYIYWGQFCVFVKKEFSKKKEKLADEIALLQSIGIVEYLNNYYRTQSQKDIQSETALKNLLLAFNEKPYFFKMSEITKFVDSRGIPLLGQYSEEDLQNFMKEKTTNSEKYILPDILTFQNKNNERFYLLPEQAVPLMISLVNASRKKIRDACIKKWHRELLEFNQTQAMKQDAAFSTLIASLIEELAPNLYGLLNASFMSALVNDPRLNDVQIAEMHRVFPNGKRAPYNKIMVLNRNELLSDAKILLPFWYTIPIIYSIIAFFKRPRKKVENEHKDAKKKKVSKASKQDFKPVVEKLMSEFTKEGMNFETTMQSYLDAWNQNLNETVRNNLTEDVNSLIRDYIRGVQKTLSALSFNADRVKSLAQTLVETPSLSKIKNKKALKAYIELYILKIAKKYF